MEIGTKVEDPFGPGPVLSQEVLHGFDVRGGRGEAGPEELRIFLARFLEIAGLSPPPRPSPLVRGLSMRADINSQFSNPGWWRRVQSEVPTKTGAFRLPSQIPPLSGLLARLPTLW